MKKRVYINADKVMELHKEGLTPSEIAVKTENDKTAIYRFYKRNGLEVNKKRKVKYTEEEEKEILKLYSTNMTIYEIQPYYSHLTTDQINYLLRDNGVTRRNGKRTYLDEDYFEVIDTEKKAYFLGLLYADGSCQKIKTSEKGYSYEIGLALNEEDDEVIRELAREVKTNLKVRTYERKYENDKIRMESKINFRSKKMFDDLWKLGKRPMKIDTCLYLPEIPKELMRHFIRGYFDGDGSVHITTAYNYLRIIIYGTFDFLSCMKDYMVNEKGLNNTSIHKKKIHNVSMYSIGKQSDIKDFYDYMYSDATVFLKRKKDVFDKYYKNNI